MTYGIPLVLLILSPFIGGLLIGIDRQVTARLQNRRGPPIMQPFYDVLKLFGKEDKIVNKTYLVFGAAYLLTVVLSVALLLFQYDLLITTFIFGLSFIFLVLAGYSVRSQFSYMGATASCCRCSPMSRSYCSRVPDPAGDRQLRDKLDIFTLRSRCYTYCRWRCWPSSSYCR